MGRLADIEAARKAEELKAKRWMVRNEKKLPPEELPQVRNYAPGQAEGRRSQRTVERVWSFGNDYSFETDSGGGERGKFVPIMGRPYVLDFRVLAKQVRVSRAVESLPVKQQRLLLGHYVEGLTLKQLNPKASRQATHESVRWAVKALLRALLDQEHESLRLRLEDF